MAPENFQTNLDSILNAAKQNGLNQKQLAIKAGVSEETISRIKRKSNADFNTLEKLAFAAGLRLTTVPDNDYMEMLMKGELF